MIRVVFWGLAASLVLAVGVLGAGRALAQTDPAGPQVVFQDLHDGDTLKEQPYIIQLCFKEPINIKDLDKGGDFAFQVTQPDGIGLGHRDIFQPDGYGIAIQPGNPVGTNLNGQWTFKYRVTTPDAQHATSGTITFNVDPNGSDRPRATPPPCVASGGTATASPVGSSPTPVANASATASPGGSPTKSAAPSGSSSPTIRPASGSPSITPAPVDSEDGGPDIGRLAFLTIGAAGIGAVVLLLGYGIRRFTGFDWHKPGSGGDDSHH